MRSINYPADIRKLKQDYLAIFNIKKLQKKWGEIWRKNPFIRSHFPKRIQKILLADYHHLLIYYVNFTRRMQADISEKEIQTLKSIFDYSNQYQPLISQFFMSHSVELGLSVCHYCETSYINSYQVPNNDSDYLYYLNNASHDELKKKLKLCDRTINAIVRMRPIDSIDDFERVGKARKYWNKPDKIRQLFPRSVSKNHFDLDHVLDKGSCPITALSLMNFVPSCQVCNQKLKKSVPLGDRSTNRPIEHLSPTSPLFDFDNKVELRIMPIPKADGSLPNPAFAIDERDYFDIEFHALDHDFDHFISLFLLNERYRFHIMEGLYWIQTKARYSDASIALMSRGLGVVGLTVDRIKEDIFRYDYDKIRKPTFAKLKKDCLK